MRHCRLSHLTVPRHLPQHLPTPWAQHYTACHLHSLYAQCVRHCQLSYLTVSRPLLQHLPPPCAQQNSPATCTLSTLSARGIASCLTWLFLVLSCSTCLYPGLNRIPLPPALSLITVRDELPAVLPYCSSSSTTALASTLGLT
ncbi:hypothetical protein DPMN_035409 [Dreissena polymorpha]|uniref:Uncharacterized protein n=1 Tax=Dreissena polymorpha TaxID=45954 RepID=A0A9D4M9F9_DREPO|nr:hypothetical protein DPMN_035409 [Dreissena polymorpha]